MTRRGNPPTWAIIAGGGTAGHVLPAVSIARALVARGHAVETIHLVGSARGMEATVVPEAGFGLTLLPGRGIQRKLTVANVGAVVGLLRALVAAFVLVARRRPAVVVAVGGYASVPCALAAAVLRVPIVVAEQNAMPGAANRLTARFAKAAAVAFAGTPLPRAVVTGNPVRPEILEAASANRPATRAAMGVAGDRRLVLAFGGSLGALRINRSVIDAARRWKDRDDLAVRHVVGRRDWPVLRDELPRPGDGALAYTAVEYEEDMPTALVACDLAVTRAGSSTIFELAALGVPAILVPSPFVTADHQTVNARHVAAAGAAVVLPDADLDGARLAAEVDRLLADPAGLEAMAAAARTLARPDAADRVAELAEQHARRA
jgi:undecaprenyldiphospho-muramoylpentapeptide beta-N-acetylglucosaminyltransferase